MRDVRQSSVWSNYLKSIGWKVEKLNSTYIYLKKFPVLGFFVKIQRPEKLTDKMINFILKKYSPFQFLIEPSSTDQTDLLGKLGFKISKSASLPTKTLQLDITKSKDDLLKSFSQKTRYNIKLSQKKEIIIENSPNISLFTKFWRKNFEKKRFPFFSQQKNIVAMHKFFGSNSPLFLARKDGKIVAGLHVLIYDRVAYYMYGVSDKTGKKNFAPTLLTWNAILLAKKMGCKVFDFDGIYDERFPIESFLGFTKFKKGFGGKEIMFPGSFVKTKSWFKI